jgi:hypothetical protein
LYALGEARKIGTGLQTTDNDTLTDKRAEAKGQMDYERLRTQNRP